MTGQASSTCQPIAALWPHGPYRTILVWVLCQQWCAITALFISPRQVEVGSPESSFPHVGNWLELDRSQTQAPDNPWLHLSHPAVGSQEALLGYSLAPQLVRMAWVGEATPGPHAGLQGGRKHFGCCGNRMLFIQHLLLEAHSSDRQ